MSDVLSLLHRHRSIRTYHDAPVPDDDLRRAVEAGQMASTSSAVQAYCVIRVTDPAVRRALVGLAGNQEKVARSGAFLVVCGDTRRHRLAGQRQGQPYDQTLEAFLVSVVDASLFAQNLVIALESMGYGICYIGAIRNHLAEVDRLLALPHGVYPIFGLCVGRPAEEPDAKPRLPAEAVLFDDRYPDDAAMLELIDRYDQDHGAALAKRGSAAASWSNRMAAKQARAERADLAAFYRGKGASLD